MSRIAIPVLHAKDARGGTILRSPKLGLWSDPPQDGASVGPGSTLGTLTQLHRRFVLVVPDGVSGRVVIADRPQDAVPVEYGETLLYVTALASVEAVTGSEEAKPLGAPIGTLEIVAPTDGVFYRSPSRDATPYVSVGDRVTTGRPVGLIEVMKTFNPIAYGGAGFPDEAEIVAVLAADAQEVRAGQALVVVKRL
jgi:acetyl-CoA carboxylase biotin carboxyl carrier protein